jgi:hypothetical protein
LGLTRQRQSGRFLEGSEMSVRGKQPDAVLEPLEQFGEIAKGISPCRVGRKAARVRRAADESAGPIMKRAERIVPLNAVALLRFAAASQFLSTSPACRSCAAQPSRSDGCGSAWVLHAAALQPTRI